tara:strand:+ start:1446 stop:2834 length:1389 start_codon:yes stop_codon:yes gene_type:complete
MSGKYDLRQDPTQTEITNMRDKSGMSTARTDKKHEDINNYYRDLAIQAKAQKGCDREDGANIDLIADSMAEMTLMKENFVGGGGGRQTGGQLIDFMVPMLLLFSGDVNAFFQSAGGKVDAIINWFAGWWSRLSDCVKGFWRSIFGTDETDENAAAAALLGLGGNQPEREADTWNYIMEMIGSATTSAMEGAAAVQTKIQPSIVWAKANRVQFGAGIAAMGSNIYLFGDTVAGGVMGLLNFLQDVPLTHWMVATSIIASYLAMRGTGNIDDDRAVIVQIINAAPADVIVATHTTPAKIKAVQTKIKTYYTEAQTRGLLEAQGITETAEEGLGAAQMRNAAARQRNARKKALESKRNEASTKIATLVSARRAKQAAVAAATREKKRGEAVNAKRAAPDLSAAGASAGSGQPSLTKFGFVPSAGAGSLSRSDSLGGGKRNTKKRSNKKKKTKKHKKKQHRKTKRG